MPSNCFVIWRDAFQRRRPQLLVDGVGPEDPVALSEPVAASLLAPSLLVPSLLDEPLSFALSAPPFVSSLLDDPLSFLALSL